MFADLREKYKAFFGLSELGSRNAVSFIDNETSVDRHRRSRARRHLHLSRGDTLDCLVNGRCAFANRGIGGRPLKHGNSVARPEADYRLNSHESTVHGSANVD